MAKVIQKNDIETFLNGKDEQERIVNLEYSYQDDFIRVYYRDENDNKCCSKQPFYPFLWAKKEACLKLCGGDKTKLIPLLRKYGIWTKALDVTNSKGETVEEMLDGYTFMFYAKSPLSYSKFLEFFKKAGNPVYKDKKNSEDKGSSSNSEYLVVTPQEQFLIYTGKRFFKGYDDYDDTLRLIFDLETTGLDTEKDQIEQFGIRFNRDVKYKGEYITFERIFSVQGDTKEEKELSELENIVNFLKIIYTFKPDIITAHNGEAFDWNIIIGACKRLGTSLEELSAKFFNGTPIKKDNRESILKLGGEIETYHRTIVPGVIVTDSLHAVRRAQALDSNMLESGLKYVSVYSKLVKPNRVYLPGDKISKVYGDNQKRYAFNDKNGDWYIYDVDTCKSFVDDNKRKRNYIPRFKNIAEGYELVTGRYIGERYLLDDLWECDKVEHRYNIPNFLICKMIPVPFQKCCTMGTAGQWKSMLLAWSYENNLAIPNFSDKKKFTGGLSRLIEVGFIDNVAKFDYNSLYPSIILTWGITDNKDLMMAMLAFLEHVLTQREKYKKLKKQAGKKAEDIKKKIQNGEYKDDEEYRALVDEMSKWLAEESANDKKQLPLKIFGNSYFGSYGAPNVFPWGNIECAERVTCSGRQALRLMIYWFSKLGYRPIVGDTDGFNFKLPDNSKYRYTEENPYISTGLSRETEKDKKYVGFKADVAEFNDLFMRDFHYGENCVNKMGLGIDEIVNSTINFSRKNYADYFPDEPFPNDVKLVGNTIKSKKMPEYISKFLEKGVRLLLQKKGQEFIEEYYSYIERIYNYQIPIKQIASKGKVKKSIEDYIADCSTITKAGRPKSRQAWMELAIKNNLKVSMGETIYYINVGKSKSQADVKKVKHYYIIDNESGTKKENKVALEKEWKKDNIEGKLAPADKKLSFDDYVKKNHKEILVEEEIILNCNLVPREIVDSDEDFMCPEGSEYNVPKYISQFNSRITPLLVCFNPEIRNQILITNPGERKYFTKEQCELCSGFPNKEGDQDTYVQLMTMEDKEIKFWKRHPEWKIPYLEEIGMNWDEIVSDYDARMEREKQLGIDKVKETFNNYISNMGFEDFDKFEEGELPGKLSEIIDIDPKTGFFVSKSYNDIVIGTINDILDAKDEKIASLDLENEDIQDYSYAEEIRK